MKSSAYYSYNNLGLPGWDDSYTIPHRVNGFRRNLFRGIYERSRPSLLLVLNPTKLNNTEFMEKF